MHVLMRKEHAQHIQLMLIVEENQMEHFVNGIQVALELVLMKQPLFVLILLL